MVALIRGINVGGAARLPMATLRSVAGRVGLDDVVTYVQSGNLVFGTEHDPAPVADLLHRALLAETGLDLGVVIRTACEWAAVVEANPFPDATGDGTKLHVTFLRERRSDSAFAGIDATRFAPERFAVVGREIYMSLPEGLGRSALAPVLSRAGAADGNVATTRNWNTVLKLAEMVSR
jgi:uncharacterized protein (DUF1697 family)